MYKFLRDVYFANTVLVRICEAPVMIEDFVSHVCYYFSNHTAAVEVLMHLHTAC